MKQYTVIMLVGVGAIAVIASVVAADIARLTVSTQEHDLYVDAIVDRQSLFTVARVTVQNTGSSELTGVTVNFGGGDKLELGTMRAGQKHIVSPPEGNPMSMVIVSADQNVLLTTQYRELPKMVGMMGS